MTDFDNGPPTNRSRWRWVERIVIAIAIGSVLAGTFVVIMFFTLCGNLGKMKVHGDAGSNSIPGLESKVVAIE